METLVLKAFTVIFRMVGILLVAGTMAAVLGDLQKLAFDSKRHGLVSMLNINKQLVGNASCLNNNRKR
jgi:hypothetical protein